MSHLAEGTQRITVWTLEPDEGKTFPIHRTYRGNSSRTEVQMVVVKQVVTDSEYTTVEVSLIAAPGRTWRWSSADPHENRRVLLEGTDPEVLDLLKRHADAVLR